MQKLFRNVNDINSEFLQFHAFTFKTEFVNVSKSFELLSEIFFLFYENHLNIEQRKRVLVYIQIPWRLLRCKPNLILKLSLHEKNAVMKIQNLFFFLQISTQIFIWSNLCVSDCRHNKWSRSWEILAALH